jgi:hypothetical protein
MVAIGKVVLTSREDIIALECTDKRVAMPETAKVEFE